MGMGQMVSEVGRKNAGGPGGVGAVGEGGGGARGGLEPGAGSGLTLVELKVLRCELADKEQSLYDSEKRLCRAGRWGRGREVRKNRLVVSRRRHEVESRIRSMEGE